MNFVPGQDRVISVRKLAAVKRFVEAEGLEWTAITARLDIAPDLADRTGDMMPIRLLMRLLDDLAGTLQDDAVGLRIGLGIPFGAAGLFDYLAASASSVREAVRNWERFHAIPTDAFELRFEETDRCGRLRWDIPDCYGPRAQLVGLLLGYVVGRLRSMLAAPSATLRADFSHAEPANVAAYRQLLGADLGFDRPVDALCLPREWLDVVPQSSDPVLLRLLEQPALSALAEREAAADELFLVTRHVTASLQCGGPTLDQVADRMAMSGRSLQRRLEAAGTSFRELSDRVRRDVALRYLRETDLPLAAIAPLAGFCDPSAFSRAVRTWFDASPQQIRTRGVKTD